MSFAIYYAFPACFDSFCIVITFNTLNLISYSAHVALQQACVQWQSSRWTKSWLCHCKGYAWERVLPRSCQGVYHCCRYRSLLHTCCLTQFYQGVFVFAAGAVLTPQILFNSEIQPRALGRYLCEQPLCFCQIVLKQNIVDSVVTGWPKQVKEHQEQNPDDPIPIPLDDPTPQVTTYLHTERGVSMFLMEMYHPDFYFWRIVSLWLSTPLG